MGQSIIIKQTGNNDFHNDLKFSLEASQERFWDKVYKKAFPDMIKSEICSDLHWQKQGVDRVIYMSSGHSIHIDEKIRRKVYNDILLEFLSNDVTGAPGWMEKSLSIDYMAYAFLPIKKVYLFPWQMLRRTWISFKEEWTNKYPTIKAQNNGYVTHSLAIPLSVLKKKVNAATIIKL